MTKRPRPIDRTSSCVGCGCPRHARHGGDLHLSAEGKADAWIWSCGPVCRARLGLVERYPVVGVSDDARMAHEQDVRTWAGDTEQGEW